MSEFIAIYRFDRLIGPGWHDIETREVATLIVESPNAVHAHGVATDLEPQVQLYCMVEADRELLNDPREVEIRTLEEHCQMMRELTKFVKTYVETEE